MTVTEVMDLAVKAGIPAALGVYIVHHLLSVHIPGVVKGYQQAIDQLIHANQNQQATFRESLQDQTKALTKRLEDDAKLTRAVLADLTGETRALAAAIHRLDGRSGGSAPPPAYSNGVDRIDSAPR